MKPFSAHVEDAVLDDLRRTYLDFPKELIHVPREIVETLFTVERWETPEQRPAVQPIATILSRRDPRGVSSERSSPSRAPTSALPTGESIEIFPSAGAASGGETSS